MVEDPIYLSPEEKKRMAYIEGRPDLFETKVLKILGSPSDTKVSEKNILVTTRNPGSGNALVPVLRELMKDNEVSITALTDGRAEEILEQNFQTQDISPENSILEAEKVIPVPRVILMDVASAETGLDTYAIATFIDTPKVYVEDYYTTAREFFIELSKRNLPLPDKICVIDQGAKDIIVQRFPELEGRIEITGQPAFDKFAYEDTEKLAQETKKKLGLGPSDMLVSFMSTIDELEKITRMAEALKKSGSNFYFVFRRHPRDNTSYGAYKKILIDAGLKVVDTEEFPTNDIGAASDVILTTWSTEGLHGIYRRKPTVHITDSHFKIAEGLDLPLVPVKLGASIGIDQMGKLIEVLPQLLDKNSETNKILKENMKKNYPVDGKSAKRVANIIRQYVI